MIPLSNKQLRFGFAARSCRYVLRRSACTLRPLGYLWRWNDLSGRVPARLRRGQMVDQAAVWPIICELCAPPHLVTIVCESNQIVSNYIVSNVLNKKATAPCSLACCSIANCGGSRPSRTRSRRASGCRGHQQHECIA